MSILRSSSLDSNYDFKPSSRRDYKSTLHSCRHCGQSFRQDHSKSEFCCEGCKAVHQFLTDRGLDGFYDARSKDTLRPLVGDWKAQTLDHDWSNIDFSSQAENSLRFFVEGLSCSACVWILERLESVHTAVEWSRLDLSRGVLTVSLKPESLASSRSLDQEPQPNVRADVAQTISGLGFKLQLLTKESESRTLQNRQNKRELIRLGVIGALTGNVMLFSLSLYGGVTGGEATMFRWLVALLALPVLTWGALPLYQNTINALKLKRISVDLPIALAVVSGLSAGILGLIFNLDTLFFDSSCMLVFLLQSSRTALRMLRERMDPNEDPTPHWALEKFQTESGEMVSGSALKVGATYWLRSNQRVPADSVLMQPTHSGTSDFDPRGDQKIEWDFSVLSGESRPIQVAYKSSVPAGVRLLGLGRHSSAVLMKVERAATESRIVSLLTEWRNGPRVRRSESQFFDRVGQVFSLVILLVAFALILVEPNSTGALKALTVLIVSCPCVFGVAIPLAESLAMRRAFDSGLLVREPSFFRRLMKTETTYIDKTGTLTTGRMKVQGFLNFAENPFDLDTTWALVAALEANSNHPVALALQEYVDLKQVRPVPLESAPVSLKMGGVASRYNNSTVKIVPMDTGLSPLLTVTLFCDAPLGDIRCAQFELTDERRLGARELVEELNTRSKVRVLSGDQPQPLNTLLKQLDLDPANGESRLSPAAKAERIRANQRHSLMIGDGANDAEALKEAEVSIAVRGEFSQCLDSADAVLISPSLRPIKMAFEIGAKMQSALTTCLVFTTSFNIIAASLAALGRMSPLIAAVLMPTSSALVTMISFLYLGRKKSRHSIHVEERAS